jgi:endonuclease/exonuclease/phosphatase family metal-dependent hydrolase
MKAIKKILKTLLIIILLAFTGFAGLILYAVFTDYKPIEKEIVSTGGKTENLNDTLTFSLLTWNIGYCGLDKEMDDGGTKVRTPKEKCLNNLQEVKRFLKQNDTMDFIMIQEIDKGSKRSYFTNEYDTLSKALKEYLPFFAKNYDVFFVPVPPASPMGKVLSGLAIFSKHPVSSSVRYSFPGEYGFPKQLFMLDRCFLVNRYPLAGGKELVVVNTHNEAFDPGEIRKAQMAYLKEFLLKEYSSGNYIIAGGDWNQSPPDFKPDFSGDQVNMLQMKMSSDFLPAEWEWVYDNRIPSNRTVIAAYDPSTTTTTVIDFFLLSPNLEDISVECVNLNFENSDHNPVRIKVKMKGAGK